MADIGAVRFALGTYNSFVYGLRMVAPNTSATQVRSVWSGAAGLRARRTGGRDEAARANDLRLGGAQRLRACHCHISGRARGERRYRRTDPVGQHCGRAAGWC